MISFTIWHGSEYLEFSNFISIDISKGFLIVSAPLVGRWMEQRPSELCILNLAYNNMQLIPFACTYLMFTYKKKKSFNGFATQA